MLALSRISSCVSTTDAGVVIMDTCGIGVRLFRRFKSDSLREKRSSFFSLGLLAEGRAE